MNRLDVDIIATEKHDAYRGDHLAFGAALCVDGERFGEGYAVNPLGLARCAFADGEFFPLSCGCGAPGCAGLFEPVRVKHSSGITTWEVRHPAPERAFVFDTERLRAAVQRALTEAQRQVAAALPRSAVWFAAQPAAKELEPALAVAGGEGEA